ncbi:aminoglycoside phosphotransferase family protein [Actinoplanes sp. NPDC049596]|uniref:phosphotransferase family protein n=1 Tax=unclassified Actinoplanes TaxID=2626549 RepID=UPI00341B50D4
MTRTVTLVLVDGDGNLLGERGPFEAAVPWWQTVAGFGDDIQVLRLLHGDRPAPPGGHVTYLAQATDKTRDIRKTGRDVSLTPHPRRAVYAEINGPAESLAWAQSVLPGTTASQQRTWNLSAIWRLDGPGGEPVAWLKQVPRFFAHEPDVIRLLGEVAPGLAPELIAAGDHGRMLLAHAPGEDRYGAGPELCAMIAAAFHPVQAYFAENPAARPDLPDARLKPEPFLRVAEPYREDIPGLSKLLDGLPERIAAINDCGLPDTLLHGDLHPGNVRTDENNRLTIMDWGDCVIGHPGFDILRLTSDPDVIEAWCDRWGQSGARRAIELMRPLLPLREALLCANFLDNIEPSEFPYHAEDVPAALIAAASIVGE